MDDLDRITFLTPHKDIEFDFSNAYHCSSDNSIIVEPVSYPKDDVRNWDVLASKNGNIIINDVVQNIEEQTPIQSKNGFGYVLKITYR